MKRFIAITILSLIGSTAIGQTVSDEALSECQAANSRFTKVADCLPDTDVAIAMLAVIQAEEFYGEAGARLVEACAELNDNSIGAWACVNNAISDAVELLGMVGSADKIDDPMFQGISDPALLERIEEREDEEQSRFGQRMWGGNMYKPLR